MPKTYQEEIEKERLRRIRQDERTRALGVGTFKAIAGGLGAVPTAVGKAVEQIPAGVGKLIGAVPKTPPSPYGENIPLELAGEGIREAGKAIKEEFGEQWAENKARIRRGLMGMFGLRKPIPTGTIGFREPVSSTAVSTVRPTSSTVSPVITPALQPTITPTRRVGGVGQGKFRPKVLPSESSLTSKTEMPTTTLYRGIDSKGNTIITDNPPPGVKIISRVILPQAQGVERAGRGYKERSEEVEARVNEMVDKLMTPRRGTAYEEVPRGLGEKGVPRYRQIPGEPYVPKKNRELAAQLLSRQLAEIRRLEKAELTGKYELAGHEIAGKYGLAGHKITAEVAEARNAIDRERLAYDISQVDMKNPVNIAKIVLQYSPKKRINKIDPETGYDLGYEDVPDIYTGITVLKSLGIPIPNSVLKYFEGSRVFDKSSRPPLDTFKRKK